jgi:Protein kinase domain
MNVGSGRIAVRAIAFICVSSFAVPASGAMDYVFRTQPPQGDAIVVLDGRTAGTTDAEGLALLETVEAGAHEVALRGSDGRTWPARTIHFDPVVNVLEPFDTTGATTFTVTIDTNVGGGSVVANGRVLATAGADGRAAVTLPSGVPQRITYTKSGFASAERTIVPGRDRRVTMTLAPLPSPPRKPPAVLVGAAIVLACLVVAAAAALLIAIRRGRVTGRARAKLRTIPLPAAISFDRYRLTDVLGRGGLATIYRAVDAVDDTEVAIKILEDKWVADPELVQKFLAEANALDAIRDESPEAAVVRCYRSGREGGRVTGQPFMVLELLRGETLEDLLARSGAMHERVAAAIGAQIAWSLSGAHEAGVVHRDLTPDNVMLVDEPWPGCGGIAPRAVLIDFGVAYIAELAKSTLEISITGKPGYMAPEQARGMRPTPQMDLYALGIVLYQMVSGAAPFAGDPHAVLEMQTALEAPPLPEHVSDGYRALVASMLSKNPAERPRSAMVVAGHLEGIAEGSYAQSFDETHIAL